MPPGSWHWFVNHPYNRPVSILPRKYVRASSFLNGLKEGAVKQVLVESNTLRYWEVILLTSILRHTVSLFTTWFPHTAKTTFGIWFEADIADASNFFMNIYIIIFGKTVKYCTT